MSNLFSTKTLLASSAIALGFVAVMGSAQAQQFKAAKPSFAASRQIEVLPGNAGNQPSVTAPQADNRAEASAAGTDAPPDENTAEASAAQQDAPPADAEPATAQSGSSKIIVSDETKRLNRQRYVERYEAGRYAERPYAEQRYNEPRYNERYVQPRYEQRYVEQRYVQPRQYAQRDAYAQHYKAAPSYGYVQRSAEHCAPRARY